MKEAKSTRQGYGDAMLQLGKKNKKVIALTADLTDSNKLNAFAEKYPKRFFQCGITEQNMITMAAGMALEGFVPFASSFGVFVPMRCLDQIRVSICYNEANVKLASTHCGLATGEDGAMHQALEDVSVLRALPGMTIIEPCDYEQAVKATIAAARWKGPVYLRLHRPKLPMISRTFQIGKAEVLQKGRKLTIIGSGPVLTEAVKAAGMLNFTPEIINCHTIKPLDEKMILQSVRKTKKVLVIQDHQTSGGLGGAVAELLSQKFPVRMKVLGMQDKFGESGKPVELWERYGLSAGNIVKEIKRL